MANLKKHVKQNQEKRTKAFGRSRTLRAWYPPWGIMALNKRRPSTMPRSWIANEFRKGEAYLVGVFIWCFLGFFRCFLGFFRCFLGFFRCFLGFFRCFLVGVLSFWRFLSMFGKNHEQLGGFSGRAVVFGGVFKYSTLGFASRVHDPQSVAFRT